MGFTPTIEIPLFLATLGYWLTLNVNKNILVYRTCYALLHYNQSDCALLGIVNNNMTRELEKHVQPYANNISLDEHIIHSVLSSLIGLFLAPWTDKFGRKPILIAGLLGGLISLGLHLVFAAIDNLTPWFVLTLSLPVFITGGRATFLATVSAYLVDSTSKTERGFRMGVFDIFMTIAAVMGNAASSYLLVATSYIMVYCISIVLHVMALALLIFFVPESLRERQHVNKVRGLLSWSNISEMMKTPFKRRQVSYREILLLAMFCILVGDFAIGEERLMFFFLRRKFHWTLKHYNWFSSAKKLLGMTGTFLVVYLVHTVLKVRESLIIFVGFIFYVISFVLMALANESWQIYFAAVLDLPTSGQYALTKSLLSKVVQEDEIAKIFAVLSLGSNILGPVSSAAYSALYNRTIDTNPGLYNLVSAVISAIGILVYIAIIIIEKRSSEPGFVVLENETENEDVPTTEENTADVVDQEESDSE
ncbi:putative peptidoglycan muropeptide transporter SLC46 [Rhynchophorus ferrugineus]|uniref:putative peptidoglycan muropeptide transporter SLC46 n=1 Tax=Rhynchophorus ferrugineus TaxID=354439 RepID=UPI003FCCD7E6